VGFYVIAFLFNLEEQNTLPSLWNALGDVAMEKDVAVAQVYTLGRMIVPFIT